MPEKPKYFATKKYKEWVKKQIADRKWTYQRFAVEVTRGGSKCTYQALHKLLGNEDDTPVPSNTTLMPGINRALKLPQPSHFDPTNPRYLLHAAIDANWDRLSEESQRIAELAVAVKDDGEA